MKAVAILLFMLAFSSVGFADQTTIQLQTNETQELGNFEVKGIFTFLNRPYLRAEGNTCLVSLIEDTVKINGAVRSGACKEWADKSKSDAWNYFHGNCIGGYNEELPEATFGKLFLAHDLCTVENVAKYNQRVVKISGTLLFHLDEYRTDLKDFGDNVFHTYNFAFARLIMLDDTTVEIVE